jgi:hypothetical protein
MSDNALVCGGVGACLTGTGSCKCFLGYAGDSCERCDNKYQTYHNGTGPCIKVRVPAPQMHTLTHSHSRWCLLLWISGR